MDDFLKSEDFSYSGADQGEAAAGVSAFDTWFDGSRIVHKDGRPRVVYHGTKSDFSIFDGDRANSKSKTGVPPGAMMFSTSPDVAASYAGQYTWMTGNRTWRDGGNIMPVYLSIKKPLTVNAKGDSWREIRYKGEDWDINSLTEYAKQKGYDGLIVKNIYDVGEGSGIKADTIVVFSAQQIKSAIGNNGTYERANPDIRFDRQTPAGNKDAERLDAENEAASRYRAMGMDADARALANMTDDQLRAEFAKLRSLERDWRSTKPSQLKQATLQALRKRATGFAQWAGDEVAYEDVGALSEYLDSMFEIQVAEDGLIECGRLTEPARELIGDLPVAMYHHTATGVLQKIRAGGLKIGAPTNYFNTQAGVYVSTMRAGEPVSLYSKVAAKKHGGDPLVLRVRRTLDQIIPDPDDADLNWAQGRQFVTPTVPVSDIDFGESAQLVLPFDISARESIRAVADEASRRLLPEEVSKDQVTPLAPTPFEKWFGDSRIVDHAGAPLPVFHGTQHHFHTFNPDKSPMGSFGRGMYFTDSHEVAGQYAEDTDGKPARVMEVYLSVQNPYIYRPSEEALDGFIGEGLIREVLPAEQAEQVIAGMIAREEESFGDEVMRSLQARGHDGIVVVYPSGSSSIQGMGGSTDIVAFSPGQIKSARENNGQYDAQNHDIRFDRGVVPREQNLAAFMRDSKVVNEDGTPRVVYHGTASPSWTRDGERNHFESFNGMGAGVYFTPSPSIAEEYARMDAEVGDGDPAIIPVYLSIANPKIYHDGFSSQSISPDVRAELEASGHDGVFGYSESGELVEIVAFHSGQIKSATGNGGEFSRDAVDIRFDRGLQPQRYLTSKQRAEMFRALQDEVRTTPKWLALNKAFDDAVEENQRYWKDVEAETLSRFKARFSAKPEGMTLFKDLDERQLQRVANQVYMQAVRADIANHAGVDYINAEITLRDYERSYIESRMPPENPFSEAANQRRQLENTAGFKAWFEGSKVVDRDTGLPLIAFHGTVHDFEAFKTGDPERLFSGKNGGNRTNPNSGGALGSWFAAPSNSGEYEAGNAESVAHSFIDTLDLELYQDGAHIMPVYLAIKNPMEFEGFEHFQDVRDEFFNLATFKQYMIDQGHDGFVIRESDTDGGAFRDDWVAFSPDQIKSAIGNSGDFDAMNPSIRFDRGVSARAQNLAAFLGDTKVVNSDGTPRVVYHGTATDFAEFQASKVGEFGPAIYMSSSPSEAGEYGSTHVGGANVMPLYARIENPFVGRAEEFWTAFGGEGSDADGVARARAAGYDGIIFDRPDRYYDNEANKFIDRGTTVTHYIAFDAQQIKSATGNNGDFDPSNPDIRFDAGQAGKQAQSLKDWIGASQVVADGGAPLLVYHGSKTPITAFDPARTVDGGLHFGTLEQANMRVAGKDKHIIPVYLKAENLQRSKDTGSNWREKIRSAKSAGKDGIVYLNRYEGISTEIIQRLNADGLLDKLDRMSDAQFRRAVPEARDSYIVFEPEQVRFARGAMNEGAVGANVMPVYLDLKAPLEVQVNGSMSTGETTEHILRAKEMGFDGVIFRGLEDSPETMTRADHYVAFEPAQISSGFAQSPVEAFAAWIDGTAVVDDAGAPLLLYHGTNQSFNEFDFDRSREDETIFASRNPRVAGDFALYRTVWNGANVMPVYVKANKLLEVQGNGRPIRQVEADFWTEDLQVGEFMNDYARRMGYDGIVYRNVTDDVGPNMPPVDDIYAFFSTAQFKSATGNIGTYNPANPDIRFDRAVPAESKEGFSLTAVADLPLHLRQEINRMEVAGGHKFQVEAAALLDDALVSPLVPVDAFATWFGASQVTHQGKPAVVWRGEIDGELYNVFDRAKTNEGVGFFFAVDKAQADGYAGNGTAARSFYLKAERLLDLTDPYAKKNQAFIRMYAELFDEWVDRRSGEKTDAWTMLEAGSIYDYEGTGSGTRWKALFKLAEEMGYDGVKVLDSTDGVGTAPIFVVFDPKQIKSTENTGSFDANNPDIRFDRVNNFLNWFAGSKAVDKDTGAPLRLYHGTFADFAEFSSDKSFDGGFHFGGKDAAHRRIDAWKDSEAGESESIMPVFLSIKNPKTLDADPITEDEWGIEIALAKSEGFNGIRYPNSVEGGESWVAFYPEQIKSAVGNAGEFNPTNPDIRFDRMSVAEMRAVSALAAGLKDTAVVDENGLPKVVYHGTGADFTEFSFNERGIFFAGDPRMTEAFARMRGGNPRIIPAYLSIKNPWKLISYGLDVPFIHRVDQSIETLKAQGYDGMYREEDDTWIAFYPHQVHSALSLTKQVALPADLFPGEFASEQYPGNENDHGRMVALTRQGLKNFQSWFKDSQVADEKGRPKVLYHGTRADFSQFEIGCETKNTTNLGGEWVTRRAGLFMAENRDFALEFAGMKEGAMVMPVYAAITNPIDLGRYGVPDEVYKGLEERGYNPRMLYSSGLQRWELFDEDNGGMEFVAALKDMGFDGAIIYEDDENREAQKVYVAFDPVQIKSALGNNGQYGTANQDIRFDRLGMKKVSLDGSKIVHPDGQPMVVYHGTRPGIEIDQFRARHETDGIYFTPDPGYAQGFTKELFSDTGAAGAIYPVYLNIQNPYVVETEYGSDAWNSFVDRGLNRLELKAQGYDGAILREPGGTIDQIIAFEPDQIRSAISNKTVVSDSSEIRFGIGCKTASHAFKTWFRDSKVVDALSEPAVLYHGSKTDIDKFIPSAGGEFGPGIYLTDDPGAAWKYAEWARGDAGENITPVYVSIQNPYFVNKAEWLSMTARQSPRTIQNRLKKQGYDGIIATGLNGSEKQFIAFESGQVKSSISYMDTFDYQNAYIRYKRAEFSGGDAVDYLTSEHKTLKLLGEFFRADIGVLRLKGSSALKFNGANFEDMIWLNESSQRSMHVVFGHELLHQMHRDRPDLYDGLYAILRPMLKNEVAFAARSGIENKSVDYVHEEMVADLFGERFGELKFWKTVAEKNPSLFGKVAAYMNMALFQISRFLRKNGGDDAFVCDLDRAREVIADTVVEYAEHLHQEVAVLSDEECETEDSLRPQV